jgi:ParB family chromosome partitioning protein
MASIFRRLQARHDQITGDCSSETGVYGKDFMSKRSGLGRGLDSLIPIGQETAPVQTDLHSGVITIPVAAISPNPRQPRVRFDPAELAELAASIREHGIIQPLIVRRGEQPDQYTLIAGERRLLAARQAALERVPAIVREATQQELVELALIENVQRADLSPLEAAEAYRQLVEDFGLSHEAVATRVGKSRVAVTNTLRLLKLPAAVQEAVAQVRISEGHARALLALTNPQAQVAALQSILQHDLNVRQTEELVRKLSGERPPRPPRIGLPPELAAVEDRLRHRLGTKVSINPSRKGGTVVIHYYSDEDLDALVERIDTDQE